MAAKRLLIKSTNLISTARPASQPMVAERHLTYPEVCERLRAMRGGRTLQQWEADWDGDVDFRELSAVMRGKRKPSDKLLVRMGLRRVDTVYEEIGR
jgi:hypothetical protein